MTSGIRSEPQAPGVLALLVARLRADLLRYRTLAFAGRVFGSVPRPCVLERPLFGFRLFLDVSRSLGQGLLFLEGPRFVAERGLLRGLARPGFHIVDVGANIGYYLLLWESRIGPAGRVVCVEPEPDNLVELKRNVEGNRFRNVDVVAAAAGAEDGSVSIRPGTNTGVDAGGSIRVPLRRLDSLISGPVDLIKIDVEGYEGEVLRGAQATLQRHRPTLFVEVHPWLLYEGHTVASILATLTALYSRIEAYEIADGQGAFEKAAVRYGLLPPIRRLPSEALKALESEPPRSRPFWVVCRP